jgi:hypothetical protein
MSVAVACLGNNCAVVATDSQAVGQDGNIVSVRFDKTFYLFDKQIAAAQIGLLENNHSRISDILMNHFANIPRPATLSDVVEIIKIQLASYLNSTVINAVDNNVRILLAGRTGIHTGQYRIYRIDIEESKQTTGIFTASNSYHTSAGTELFAGNQKAIAAISAALPDFSGYSIRKLRSMANMLIGIGIENTGNYDPPIQHIHACGGVPMVKFV